MTSSVADQDFQVIIEMCADVPTVQAESAKAVEQHGAEKLFAWIFNPTYAEQIGEDEAKNENLFALIGILTPKNLVDLYFQTLIEEYIGIIDEEFLWMIRDHIHDSIESVVQQVNLEDRYRLFVYIVYKEGSDIDGLDKYNLISSIEQLISPHLVPPLRSALENAHIVCSSHGEPELYLSDKKDIIAAQERLKL